MNRFLVAALVSPLLVITAQAATLNVGTGVDGSGSVLAAGTLDPNWTISTDGTSFSAARVAYPGSYPNYGSGQTCCGMDTISATAAWITTPSVTATSPVTGWGGGPDPATVPGPTVYARRTIDLTGLDAANATFSGSWRVADLADGIFINGNLVSGTNTGAYAFAADLPFSVAAGSGLFTSGLNLIELRGRSVNNVWDAFWVSGEVKAYALDIQTPPVPEPSTYALMAAGLLAVGWSARRRRS